MHNVTMSDQERAILAAALRYFRRRVEEAHLLEELAAPYSPYKDVQDIVTMKGRVPDPTVEHLHSLESKLEETIEKPLVAVIVLNGGLLDSVFVTADATQALDGFRSACNSHGISPEEPWDEDVSIYCEELKWNGSEHHLD